MVDSSSDEDNAVPSEKTYTKKAFRGSTGKTLGKF
jgi:hypothetical protein